MPRISRSVTQSTRGPSLWTLRRRAGPGACSGGTPEKPRSWLHPRSQACPTVRGLAVVVLVLGFSASFGIAAFDNPAESCIDCHAWSEDLGAGVFARTSESVCGPQLSECPVVRSWAVELCVIERLFLTIQRGLDQEKDSDPRWHSSARERLVQAWSLWEDVRTSRFREPLDAVREPLIEVRAQLAGLYQELQERRDRRKLHRVLVVALAGCSVLAAAAVAGHTWRKRIHSGTTAPTARSKRA